MFVQPPEGEITEADNMTSWKKKAYQYINFPFEPDSSPLTPQLGMPSRLKLLNVRKFIINIGILSGAYLQSKTSIHILKSQNKLRWSSPFSTKKCM